MTKYFAIGLFWVLTALGASAQTLNECNWVASAYNVVEPWPVNTTTFSNGKIRIALLDTGGEPACCSFHLLILHPDPELGRACTVLSDQQGQGWGYVVFHGIQATYNPKLGLLLQIPVDFYNPETGLIDPGRQELVSIRINQATGVIAFE